MAIGNQTVRSRPISSGTPVIYNLISPVAPDTEFSQLLTNGTKQLMIKARTANTLKLSFEPGGTSSNYITIPPNSSYNITNLYLENISLYLQSSGSETIVEIEEWT